MKKKIKVNHVGAGSIGRLVGTVNAIIALASGIIGSVVAISAVISTYDYSWLANIGIAAGIIAVGVIVVPVIAFLFGWVYGALIGLIWNVLLSTAGGLEVTIEDVPEAKK